MNVDGGGVCIICVCNLIRDICCVCVYMFCECVFECGWLKLCGSCEPLGVGTISWIGVEYYLFKVVNITCVPMRY